jgi:hypothetical protein
MRWTAEAQRSKVAVDMHAQRMTVASEAMSAMAAMLSTAGVVQNCEDRSRLFEADRAIAAMAAASRQEAAQAAQSSADASGKASELAETVSEALRVMAMDVESIASEIEDAVEIAVSRAKRQKAATAPSDAVAAREPSVGADEQEPDWLRSARADRHRSRRAGQHTAGVSIDGDNSCAAVCRVYPTASMARLGQTEASHDSARGRRSGGGASGSCPAEA